MSDLDLKCQCGGIERWEISKDSPTLTCVSCGRSYYWDGEGWSRLEEVEDVR
jgi:uncharacterized protein with PIN domain